MSVCCLSSFTLFTVPKKINNLVWGWCVLFFVCLFVCFILAVTGLWQPLFMDPANGNSNRRLWNAEPACVWTESQLMLWRLIGGKIVILQIVIFNNSSACMSESLLECCCLNTAGQENTLCNADEMRWPNWSTFLFSLFKALILFVLTKKGGGFFSSHLRKNAFF